jgi:hypothetical protein
MSVNTPNNQNGGWIQEFFKPLVLVFREKKDAGRGSILKMHHFCLDRTNFLKGASNSLNPYYGSTIAEIV